MMYYEGIQVVVSALLPYEQTWACCDIETKDQFNICSGEWINAMMVNNKLWVSQSLFDKLSQELIKE